ncbi:reverse transcriptase domain-containing protein [Tanacetum coccineum]
MSTTGQGMSFAEIEQIVAQRVTNAIEEIPIYETKTHVARDSIDHVIRKGAKIANNVKRKWESGYDGNSSQQQNKQHKVVKAYPVGLNSKKGYAGKCKLHHTGPYPFKCRRCQKIGHQSKDCRSKTPATGSNSKHVVTCHTPPRRKREA